MSDMKKNGAVLFFFSFVSLRVLCGGKLLLCAYLNYKASL